MNLTGLHILLTYQCNYECDHCFVWGSPSQTGVFTLAQLEEVYQQALELGTVRSFYFEGGEAFLYYPILLKAVARAKALGFWAGIVSNNYWATSVEDAVEWLRPLVEAGLDTIELSTDLFHGDEMETPESRRALDAAQQLGLTTVSTICIDPPTGYRDPSESKPGEPVTGGGVMYRGRAAEQLVEGLPRQPWETFTACPYENLADPGRVHLDPLGNLHLCQGLVMGNMFQRPLKEIVQDYDPATHPVVGPLLAGGPAGLAQRYDLDHQPGYVDACHLCDAMRQALRARFPEALGPDQMYGDF
jgi:MoaA/NifB/PqqE/SkfB family radical SAM enzyme